MNKEDYNYWHVWGRTFEDDEVWFSVAAPDDWDSDRVLQHAIDRCPGYGVGGEISEILRVECGYVDDMAEYYCDYDK
jgi:hypothetical protein